MDEIVKYILGGIISGVFAGGTVYGMLKTELKYLRRDVDEIRVHVFGRRKLFDESVGKEK